MDPLTHQQLDYGDEEYEGSQKMQYHQGGAIPALADDEMVGDEDEYDDLYNDVNVGEGFLKMQQSEARLPSDVGNGGSHASKTNFPGTRGETIPSQEANNARVANEGNYPSAGVQLTGQKIGLPASGGHTQNIDASERGRLPEMAHNYQAGNLGYQGSESVLHKTAADQMNKPEKLVGEPAPSMHPYLGSTQTIPQTPIGLVSSSAIVNRNQKVDEEYLVRPSAENGNTMLFVGELQWWTTDAELERALIQYGKVKEIKFFDERASGKSKGYCQVEFYDSAAAAACKEGMHGHVFNGRACVVAFATPQTIRQMGSSYMNKTQPQAQSQKKERNKNTMALNDHFATRNSMFIPLLFLFLFASSTLAALVQEQPLLLKYHNGALLKGTVTVNLIWYGKFTPTQRSIIVDFLQSLNAVKTSPQPSVSSWWKTTEKYKGISGASTLVVGKQFLDENYSLGKSLKNSNIVYLAARGGHLRGAVNVVLTAKDVAVDGFCRSSCGTHGSNRGVARFAYAWVGNSETQCPGYCAWPFHQPLYGPQTPPLVAPNGDVGVDGMVINLAAVLAGTVTNPFKNGYFQGPATAPLEAVTACSGVFGSGAYPGYAGSVLTDKSTGASYNAHGANGRKYLLPAMWDPQTSQCSTLV